MGQISSGGMKAVARDLIGAGTKINDASMTIVGTNGF
jgi:hypothetical protein